jgi:hypothetical protein
MSIQTLTRQPNFTRLLRRDKETYESVHKLVEHLAIATGQEFNTLWSHVTDSDDAHFKRKFRRQRKKHDPCHDIKNAVPAYSFFTQEWNVKVAAEHPNLTFGEKSKLVGEKWRNLSRKEKSKYEKLAAKDKMRYQDEVEKCSRELATASLDEFSQSNSDSELLDSQYENNIPFIDIKNTNQVEVITDNTITDNDCEFSHYLSDSSDNEELFTKKEEYKVTLLKSLTNGYVSEENYNNRLKWLDNFLTTEYNTVTKLFTAFKTEVFNKA